LLNDAIIFLQALEQGHVVLTRNIREPAGRASISLRNTMKSSEARWI
jgi:hypothetical protein